MRITTNMMTNKFLNNLSKSSIALDKANTIATTGKKFSRASEDVISATKSFSLKGERRATDMYSRNIIEADSYIVSAETSLKHISKNVEDVYSLHLRGMTGTMGPDEKEIIATQLDNLQSSILQSLNSKHSDRYSFGGTSKDTEPFSIDANTGELLYKGINIDTGLDADGNAVNMGELAEERVSIDIGIGKLMGPDGNVGKQNTFDISTSGLKITGYGKDENGLSNNIYNIIGKIKDGLKDGMPFDELTTYTAKFKEQKNTVLNGLTDIGAKSSHLDFIKLRNDDRQFDLDINITEVEDVDYERAVLDFAMKQYSYNAALQMGNKLMQNSFIDFIN